MRIIDILVKDSKGRPIPGASIDFLLNDQPAGGVPNSEGRGRIELPDGSDSVEVQVSYNGETKKEKLGPNQNVYTFLYDVDLSPPAPVRPDLIDAFIVLLLAAAIDIFVFAMATQFINNPVFQKLPSFITDAYTAVWTSVVAGAAGIGAAILKTVNRPPGTQTPNYLVYVLVTALSIVAVIIGLALVALWLPKPT
jgi:F0F1-type ATP synthase membrane subunit c/vacuolar-type H+-ATPase subunit K